MLLPDCGAPHEHILPSTLVLYQCRFLSTHVVHPPPAIVMAATATERTWFVCKLLSTRARYPPLQVEFLATLDGETSALQLPLPRKAFVPHAGRAEPKCAATQPHILQLQLQPQN